MKISPLASEICPVKRWSVGGLLEFRPLQLHFRGAAGGSWRVATVPPSANPRLHGRANPAGLGASARRHNFPILRPRRLLAFYPCSSVPSVILTAKASAKREFVAPKGRFRWRHLICGRSSTRLRSREQVAALELDQPVLMAPFERLRHPRLAQTAGHGWQLLCRRHCQPFSFAYVNYMY